MKGRSQRPAADFESDADFAVRRFGTGRRNRFARTTQAVQMEFDGIMHLALHALSSFAGGNAAGKIGGIRRIAGASFFDDNKVTAHFNPACFRILFCVPGARSSLGFPAMVTTPFLWLCRYCRWLPRVRSRYHPSSSIILIIARTFTAADRDNSTPSGQTRDLSKSVNGADGISEIEGKVARVCGEGVGKRPSFN